MGSKLEPTAAQRKAMHDALDEAIDKLFTLVGIGDAANSVPEGAPVGTIARRPDGAWKAERKAGEAGPYWQYSTSAFWQADSPDWNSEDDADSTAQQEPAYTVAAASEEMAKYWDNSIVTTTKREPRVVDRLGVDERGSRWHGAEGAAAYFHDGQSWRTNQGRVFAAGYQPDWNAPYTEILEPRVLPSLDCEEARDGVGRDKT